MRKVLFLFTAVSMLIAGGLLAMPSTRPQMVTSPQATEQPERNSVSLTIYNQGSALVQDRRTFTLQLGANVINFTDVAAQIDATSVIFTSLTDPRGTTVLEQNYVYDLVNTAALLKRYLDQTITVVTTDGSEYTGQLLSAASGDIILRQGDGQVIVVRPQQVRDLRFSDLPGGLITRPTLRWLVNSSTDGDQEVELTYLTRGVSWIADYNVVLKAGNTALDLTGWVTFNNTSGAAYEDAQVKLIAGDVNRLPPPQPLGYAVLPTASPSPTGLPDTGGGVSQREFYEYNLYEINRPVTVGDNETKQVEFVSGINVPAHTYYVYDASYPVYSYSYSPNTSQGYGQTGITDVRNYLEFSTGEESGLGADLPAGRIRVYQADIDGAPLLIGENRIDHTPEGEEIDLYLGNAFDLVGERMQTDFALFDDNVLQEVYEIRLRNRKEDQAVEIRVPERMFRWSNWEIISSSHQYEQLDSATIEFRPIVRPGEEVVITYTVRYSWP